MSLSGRRLPPALLPLLVALPLLPSLRAPAGAAPPGPREVRPIAITVDATEAPRRILHVREQIPVEKAGPLLLHYPRWQPGAHGPVIPPLNLVGLFVRAGGRTLPWRRDDVEVSSFHVEVPAATAWLEVEFDYVSAPGGGALLLAERVALLDWIYLVLYPEAPKGRDAIAQTLAPRIKLPPEWRAAGALVDPAATATPPGELALPVVTLETLVDSPVLIGPHLKRYPLGEVAGAAHEVDVGGETAESIEAPSELAEAWARLPAEALALFGSRHYRHYRFLLTLSNQATRSGGLEHHESSDNKAHERALLDRPQRLRMAGLLPHEFTHSWCGKYRRPTGLCTGDFQAPMKDDLLWVYEGLTTFYGDVLTARSGLRTPLEARESLALTASDMELRAGRAWRPLQDTAVGAASGGGGPEEWSSWRRGLDYYPEAMLLWLEVDTTLRQLSGGKVSMDDFARRFLGGQSGGPAVRPYGFDDVVNDLDALVHHDWRGLLRARLDETAAHAPLLGLTAAGWRLAWNDEPNLVQKASEASGKTLQLRGSLGLLLKEDGTIVDASPGMPAAKAGAAPQMKIRAVNGRRFSREVMEDALRASRSNPALDLLVENDEWFRTLRVQYGGGLRIPHLEKIEGTPDLLGQIFQARAGQAKPATPATPPTPAAPAAPASPAAPAAPAAPAK